MIYSCLLILLSYSFIIQSQSQLIAAINGQEFNNNVSYQYLRSEIRNAFNLNAISSFARSELNSSKCFQSLSSIVSEMPAQKFLPFIDSWGRIPSGILKFNLMSLGNFDECLDISVKVNEDIGVINGQYCLATISLKIDQKLLPLNNSQRAGTDGVITPAIKIGICAPDSCSAEMLTDLFQMAVNNSIAGVSVNQCKVKTRPALDANELTGIILLSIIVLFVAMSSSYDLIMRSLKITPNNILLAFSIFANGKKIFAISTKKSPNSIDCLAGIRVLSMIWVLYCHTYLYSLLGPVMNLGDVQEWRLKAWSLHVINAAVSVDSFLLMSGLLVGWLGFQELDKTRGKLNILKMYIHRYIRLTAPVAGVIIFIISIYKLVLVGPNDYMYLNLNGQCSTHWWVTLLYVQNYVETDKICMPQTWYLAVDFQLYILSPLVLIPMWKWGKKCVPVLICLITLSVGCVIATFYTEGYNNLIDVSGLDRMKKVYFPTHTRYSAWLIGLALGYFMHINRQKVFRPTKIIQFLGWIICFGTLLTVIFGTYFTTKSNRNVTIIEAALYDSLKRISWSIAVAWIVFASHFGFGGLVNSFLSHPFWQPLSRLTYSFYLVHFAIIGFNFGGLRTNTHFSDYDEVIYFWGIFGMSLIAALALSLTFEAPVLVFEKAIHERLNEKQDETESDLIQSRDKINVHPNESV